MSARVLRARVLRPTGADEASDISIRQCVMPAASRARLGRVCQSKSLWSLILCVTHLILRSSLASSSHQGPDKMQNHLGVDGFLLLPLLECKRI